MAEFELDGINSCLVFCLALVVDFETRIWNAQYLKLYIQIMYLIENTKNIFLKCWVHFYTYGHVWYKPLWCQKMCGFPKVEFAWIHTFLVVCSSLYLLLALRCLFCRNVYNYYFAYFIQLYETTKCIIIVAVTMFLKTNYQSLTSTW